ncbi:MAG: sulfite exporter TauE/SafE family protein [Candidatus Marinimicrobia bacterium]|nr:sulfite exporter TauE/SafE family protein [Candidatus Neomarinimicrobiota bacterium]
MELQVLLITALSIGFVHTLIGPDHYLPFILIGRARKWSLKFTTLVTIICGIGHVLGSVLLGLVGVVFGVAVGALERVEAVRGDLASWLLIGVGVAYGVWGLRIGLRASEHTHEHDHTTGHHHHSHHHLSSHAHIHGDVKSITPWALFIVFVLGPCEPLIPILMYPAAKHSWGDLVWVTFTFGVITITTMTTIVMVMSKGLLKIKLGFLERYVHALSGVIIAVSGLSIKVFGL